MDQNNFKKRDEVTGVSVPLNSGSPHGTTIIWARLGNKLLVGVDSMASQTKTAEFPNETWEYRVLFSEDCMKFVQLGYKVYGALCGNLWRCEKMLKFVETEEEKFKREFNIQFNFDEYCIAVREFFTRYPNGGKSPSIVYLCGWKNNAPIVVTIGDHHPQILVKQNEKLKFFGAGSGYQSCITTLKKKSSEYDILDIPTGAGHIRDALIRATLSDSYTGGVLRVYSLIEGECQIAYEGHMLDSRALTPLKETFDEGKTMLVVIENDHEHILSPEALILETQRFDQEIAKVYLLRRVNRFLLYRVVLRSTQVCKDWFLSCQEFKKPIRCHTYTDEGNRSCEYYIGRATIDLVQRANRMSSFDDLAEKEQEGGCSRQQQLVQLLGNMVQTSSN